MNLTNLAQLISFLERICIPRSSTEGDYNPTGYPTPFHSCFGWVLIGEAFHTPDSTAVSHPVTQDISSLTSHLCISNSSTLDEQLKQFWELEHIPNLRHSSSDDIFCEEHFQNTHSRDPSTGRYIVKLSFREDAGLGESFDNALFRFQSLEKRLDSKPDLKTSYDAFMNEYEHLGHMRPLQPQDQTPKYYIPHHGVQKDSSSTTKFRTVFMPPLFALMENP